MRRGLIGRLCAIAVLWLCAATLHAATPLMTRFTPDVDIYPQYFAVARSDDGLLYVGASDAILRFDGVRWESIALPRPGTVRTLVRDRRGRLWYGATDSFGRIERTPEGGERLIDYAGAFAADVGPQGFVDVWDIVEHGDSLYFRALRWLFEIDGEGRRRGIWHAPERFGGIVGHAGDLVVNWRGEGLKRRVGDRFELIPGGEQFAKEPAFTLLSLDAKRLLVHDQTPRLAVLEDGRLRPVLGDGDTRHFNDGILLDARHAAYAGDDGLLRVVDVDAGSVRQISLGTTFQGNLAVDGDGALLVVDDAGVVRLPWPAAWNVYGSEAGVRGGVHDVQYDAGLLRVLTTIGELTVPWNGAGTTQSFTADTDYEGEAWSRLSDGAASVLADSYGLRRADGSRLGPDDLYPRLLARSRFDPTRAWVGTESGFALLRRAADGWQIETPHTELQARVMSLVDTAPDTAWLGSDDNGLLRVRVAADPAQPPQIERFDAQVGLGGPDSAVVSELGGAVYASTEAGLFRWNGERFAADALDGLAALLPAKEIVHLREGVGGVAWAYSFLSVYRRDAAKRWQRVDAIDRGTGAIESLTALPDGDVVVGSDGRVLHYDAAAASPRQIEPMLRLQSVQLLRRDGTSRALPLGREAAIDYGAGTLRLRAGLVDLSSSTPPQFQARVIGLDEGWSDWSTRAEFSYALLPPGAYRFEVRARAGSGQVFPAQALDLRIVPRWYQRGSLQLLLALLGVAVLAFVLSVGLRARIRRLDARNRQLQALVRAHTAELEQANTQLRDLAERDGLTGVANRRRFDAFLAAALAAAAQTRRPVALLLADVDHFKAYNDAHGHLAGDTVLRCVAAALVRGVRDNTLVARFGGEEFCLVVPHCDLAAAGELGRRLCASVSGTCGVTVSIGAAATLPEDTGAAEQLLARADAALYRAKHEGRNRVALAEQGEKQEPDVSR
ncbi:MAG TPA: GGDEF domain-containing protein [Tahibacter sp.]|uniref:ligand-binding sensor domain-containing diguanylate cyclase n=1 Tax=Tahibacter sp. TaxID=2056211 RepID=UPI002BD9436C|nr:GGDEF domain-containing protein [Tahibacter sp.]HSX62625.1 GGDEF domain-containing protein [Tahibacter sp.]